MASKLIINLSLEDMNPDEYGLRLENVSERLGKFRSISEFFADQAIFLEARREMVVLVQHVSESKFSSMFISILCFSCVFIQGKVVGS